jgi:malate dehydrogenase (oxaloacetate-decarboxylating)(NADP+)
VIEGADLFLGLSGPNVLTPEMVARWPSARSSSRWPTRRPRSCPTGARGRAGRDHRHGPQRFPNQVNNVLCFPFIFRGALDVGATEINDAMQIACVEGIAALARATTSAEAARPTRASS